MKIDIPWRNEETWLLQDEYGKISVEQIADRLGRSVRSVEGKIRRLRAKGWEPEPSRLTRSWPFRDTQFLKDCLNEGWIVRDIAIELGKSYKAVIAKKRRLRGRGWVQEKPRPVQPTNLLPLKEELITASTPSGHEKHNLFQVRTRKGYFYVLDQAEAVLLCTKHGGGNVECLGPVTTTSPRPKFNRFLQELGAVA